MGLFGKSDDKSTGSLGLFHKKAKKKEGMSLFGDDNNKRKKSTETTGLGMF